MQNMELWEMLALGAVALLVIFWFRPGIRAAMEQSRNAEKKDWMSLLAPLLLVVVFVIVLIAIN